MQDNLYQRQCARGKYKITLYLPGRFFCPYFSQHQVLTLFVQDFYIILIIFVLLLFTTNTIFSFCGKDEHSEACHLHRTVLLTFTFPLDIFFVG